MSVAFHKMMLFTAGLAVFALLVGGTMAFAQRDAGAKARGDIGKGFWSSGSQQAAPGRSISSEPRRSFSYEPADKSEKSAPAVKDAGRRGCKKSVKSKSADDSTAKAPQATRRAYSYEPSMKSGSRHRGSGKSNKAPWSYQKTDPRRYQN